jgi:hypothetical protein
MDALRNGELSTREAHASGKAEEADPERGAALVQRAQAGNESVRELEQESSRIVNAASGESEAERAERIRKNRAFRGGDNGDGSGWRHIVGPTADLARLDAAMKPLLNDIFIDAREEGRREPHEAYAFDALMGLVDRKTAVGPDATAETSADGWEFAKVIIRADLAALDRGRPEPGELCEIAGQGPVPVADVWRMIDGGAFIAGILTAGTDILKVHHLGRRPTVLQRTILEWETAGICIVEGCTRPVAEIDHVEDWAHTHITQLRDLAGLCRHHHQLKTHHGYTLGPRLPNGNRHLHPPGETPPGNQPPDDTGPPDLEAPSPAPFDEAAQGGLFDTS